MGTDGKNVKAPGELDQEIYGCCKKLRLSAGFAERAIEKGGQKEKLFLHGILTEEVRCRKEKRMSSLLEEAGFPAVYETGDFDPSEVAFPNEYDYGRLAGLGFFDEGKNLVMYGRPGTGKTMLSIILGAELARKGIRVRYFRTASLIRRLKDLRDRGRLDGFLDGLSKVDAAILDELGYTPYDLDGCRLLFEMASELQSGGKCIMTTTNIGISRWGEVIPDNDLAGAFIGRVTGNSLIIKFQGRDRRAREAASTKGH